jgi:hypothetical protein
MTYISDAGSFLGNGHMTPARLEVLQKGTNSVLYQRFFLSLAPYLRMITSS